MPISNPELLQQARARAEEKRKDTRFRLWEFVAFCDLDEAVPDWKDRLKYIFVGYEVFVSPIHDSDGAKDNTHILVKSKTYKTKEQIVDLLKQIVPIDRGTGSFVGVPDVIPSSPQDTSERLRYWIHADPDGKALPQYNPDDFYIVGTADPLKKIKWTAEEQDLYAQNMMDFAKSQNVQSLKELRSAFADSRIYTYMLTQVRVKDQLKWYFDELTQSKLSEQNAHMEQLQEQLLEQSKKTEQLQKRLLACELRQYIHVLKVDFTSKDALRAKELGARFDRHSSFIFYLGEYDPKYEDFDEYCTIEPILAVYDGLLANDKYQLQDKNGWTYNDRKKAFS